MKRVKSQPQARLRPPRPHLTEAALEIDEVVAGELTARLARVEGQVRAVSRMIEERRDCHAILLQLSAARAALQRATAHLMVSNLAACLRTASTAADETELQKLTEAFVKLL